MTNLSNVPKQETIIKLLTVLFPHATIYLFGSRARGTHRPSSDIDIAINLGREMTFEEIGIARNIVEGLNIPQKVDIVDMNIISESMKKEILKDGIVWKD
jgi:predicted nucleotidyltransferase